MKLLDYLRKHIAPSILGAITIDSYRRQVHSHEQEMTKIKKFNDEQLRKFQEELWGQKEIISDFKTKLNTNSSNIEEIDKLISMYESKINVISSKLNNNNLNVGESIDSLNKSKTFYLENLTNLNQIKNEHVNKLIEIINDNSISKNDISGFLSDFIDKYQSIINNLGLEQKVALFNILGYFMIIVTILSISTLLIGDYLIEKFNLNTKYPKLSKFIRIKQQLNKGYLAFNTILLYLLIILLILCNIYMLVLKYFV